MKHVAVWVGSWLALFWLWMLLDGTWNHIAWIAAACAATVAATVGEVARSRAGAELRVPFRWLLRGWTVPWQILVDFWILVRVLVLSLVRRRVVRGVFRSHEFPAGGADLTSVGIRVWANYAGNFSPNAYVVEIEPERSLSLVHDLVPNRSSEEPA